MRQSPLGGFDSMPQIVLPALLSATVSTASVGFVGFGSAFMVNAALGAAMYALSPQPKAAGQSAQTFAVKSSNETRKIVYGEARVGGVLTFAESSNDETYLHLVVTFAAHEVNSFKTFYIDGEALTLSGNDVTAPAKYVGKIKVYPVNVGLVANTPAALISDTSWTSAHVLNGQAYTYFRFTGGDGTFTGGVPNVSVVLEGKKVYDPRDTLTAYSANPALCMRDYLADATFGLGAASSEINDASFIAAANTADEAVTLDVGGTEPRYTLNGIVDTGSTPRPNIAVMLTASNGTLYFSSGQWSIRAGVYITPTVTLTEDDFAGPINISTAVSARDSFNAVKGQYVSSETDYQATDYAEITSATFETEDGSFRKYADLNLPFTNSGATAQRLAKQVLYQNRQEISFTARFKLTAFQFEVGDTVLITLARFGWSAKVFEVSSWSLNFGPDDVSVECSMRETNSAVYSWSAEETVFASDNSTLPDPTAVPGIGIALSADGRVINEHVVNVLSVLTTTANPAQVRSVEVQFKKSSDSAWTALSTGGLGWSEVLDVDEVAYDVQARGVNVFGVPGEWTLYPDYIVSASAAPPDTVVNFSAESTPGGVHLEWDAVANFDLSHYKIRYAVETTGATWANSTTAAEKVPRPATNLTLPARSGTYSIRAYDKLGNASTSYASAVVLPADMQQFTTTASLTDSTTFTGTKTGCSVVSSALRITTPTTAPTEATYDFSTYIDTTTVHRAWVHIAANVLRVDNSSGLWDDMPGLWDTWPGLWDDWTGSSQAADQTLIFWVATTGDDPAGTPTWSDWKKFRAGYYSARAFKSRETLKSSADNITPSITGLTAYVEYD